MVTKILRCFFKHSLMFFKSNAWEAWLPHRYFVSLYVGNNANT